MFTQALFRGILSSTISRPRGEPLRGELVLGLGDPPERRCACDAGDLLEGVRVGVLADERAGEREGEIGAEDSEGWVRGPDGVTAGAVADGTELVDDNTVEEEDPVVCCATVGVDDVAGAGAGAGAETGAATLVETRELEAVSGVGAPADVAGTSL